MPVLADYFLSVSVEPSEKNIGISHPPVIIIDRYPEKDHKKHMFPKNCQYFCIEDGSKIEYVKPKKRKPKFFIFCFTREDRSRSYGTSLFFYEPFKLDNELKKDKKGRQLFVPRALSLLSHQPMFSVFCAFLRELYRHAILAEYEDEPSLATDPVSTPGSMKRRDSFHSLLHKGSLNELSVDLPDDLPLERHIRYFLEYVPSLDPGVQIHMTMFQKICSIQVPPTTALPFSDKLVMERLLLSLSPRNIAKCVAAMAQDQRILLVSDSSDSLSLCACALDSLLYPLRWKHPFIPILPSSIVESVSASFPFLMGVTTSTFHLDDCQSNIHDVVVVHLDYDKVVVPDSVSLVEFPKSFVKNLEKFVSSTIPPPDTRLLYTDHNDLQKSNFIEFEVTFGPGKLGIKIRSCSRVLIEGCAAVDCVMLVKIDPMDLSVSGPGRRVELFTREPVLLSVNGTNAVGKSTRQIEKLMSELPRPLTLRFQIGTLPNELSLNDSYRSSRASSEAWRESNEDLSGSVCSPNIPHSPSNVGGECVSERNSADKLVRDSLARLFADSCGSELMSEFKPADDDDQDDEGDEGSKAQDSVRSPSESLTDSLKDAVVNLHSSFDFGGQSSSPDETPTEPNPAPHPHRHSMDNLATRSPQQSLDKSPLPSLPAVATRSSSRPHLLNRSLHSLPSDSHIQSSLAQSLASGGPLNSGSRPDTPVTTSVSSLTPGESRELSVSDLTIDPHVFDLRSPTASPAAFRLRSHRSAWPGSPRDWAGSRLESASPYPRLFSPSALVGSSGVCDSRNSEMSDERFVRRVYSSAHLKNGVKVNDNDTGSDQLTSSSDSMQVFLGKFRVHFLLEFAELLMNYSDFFIQDQSGNVAFDSKEFCQQIVDEQARRFMKKVCKSSMFRFFADDAYEYTDNYEINLFNDCVTILQNLGPSLAPSFIHSQLAQSKWSVSASCSIAPNSDGLPADWESLAFDREFDCFPRLNSQLMGNKVRRLKLSVNETHTSILPSDFKALKKQLKSASGENK